MELVFILAIFGVVGLGMETLFSALFDFVKPSKRDRVHFRGYSSAYYFPLYGFALPGIIYFLYPQVQGQFWLLRGLVYAVVILIGEYPAMALLHLVNGASPSEKEYRASGHSINGYVRWDFLPAYALLALVFEYLVRRLLLS